MASGSEENILLRKIGANIEAETVHYTGTVNVHNKDDGLQVVGTNIRAQTVNIENPPNLNIEEFDLPPLIKTFKGREDYFKKFEILFFQEEKTKIVLCGLPGHGKSELAKQFANFCLEDEKVSQVFWIPAENKGDLRKISTSLKKIFKAYKKVRCLFVFDNGISRQSITDYEPPDNDNFLLLITSREKDWGDDVESIKLDPLSSESSIEVYKSVLSNNFREENHDLYTDLATVMGNIPLGLQITAGYMRKEMKALRQDFQLGEYVERIKQSIKEIINKKLPRCSANSYENSIYGAMKVSLDKITEEEDDELRDLAFYTLYLCAFLNPERIGVEDIIIMIKTNETLTELTCIEKKCKIALDLLDNFLFVDCIHLEYLYDFVKIHRLTQDILRIHMDEYESKLQTECYTMCLHYLLYFQTNFPYSNTSSILRHANDNLVIVNHFCNKITDDFKFEKFLCYLIEYGCINNFKQILQENKQKMNEHIYELLRASVFHYQTDCLIFLLQNGDFDINKNCYQMDYALLHEAAWKSNFDASKILIHEYNADTNIKDRFGNVPLFNFVKNSSKKAYNWDEVLSLFKFEKDTTNNNGETLLHLAICGCPVELLELLIDKYGMDVNLQDAKGRTPIHMLLPPNDENVMEIIPNIKLLLYRGASLHIKDEDYTLSSNNVLRYARKSNDTEILDILKKQNIDVNEVIIDCKGKHQRFLKHHMF